MTWDDVVPKTGGRSKSLTSIVLSKDERSGLLMSNVSKVAERSESLTSIVLRLFDAFLGVEPVFPFPAEESALLGKLITC